MDTNYPTEEKEQSSAAAAANVGTDKATLLDYLKADSKQSYDMQMRRHPQWDENYLLYRDKVVTNRLTQRQAVNLPIVRETVQTWISKIDEPPLVEFEAKSQDNDAKRAEIVINEVYMYYYDKLKLELLDNMEKKIVGLQGRAFKKIGYDSKCECMWTDIIDPYDIEVDPKANMFDLDNTAMFFNHKNIFRTLKSILANPKYSTEGKNDLKIYLQSKQGIIKITDTIEAQDKRNDRLRVLGVTNFDAMGAKDVLVEMKECYKKMWSQADGKFIWYLIIQAADCAILLNMPLKQAIGVDFLPFVTWADDPDINDPWPDGKADSVRTFNKIANIYVSQMLENRTYRNFGMFFYDSTNQKFAPNSVDPRPFGMYPMPGDPNKIVQQMRIEPLTGTIEELSFLKGLIESSVAITPTEQGVSDKSQVTLGEVQLNLQNSQQRLTVTAKNYRTAWKEYAMKFYEILKANAKGKITLYKKGPDDQYYPKDIYPKDWQHDDGFNIKVVLKSERTAQDAESLKKAQAVQGSFPNNPTAQKIAKRKVLEALGWKPDEIKAVMDTEDQLIQSAAQGAQDRQVPVAHPAESINFKDLPADGQKQMAKQAGIDLGGDGQAPGVGMSVDKVAPPIKSPLDQATLAAMMSGKK